MFSRILIKLLEQTIVPVLYLVTARIVSLVVITQVYDLPFIITKEGFTFLSHEDYVVANSLSVLAMSICLSVGLIYVVVKSIIFHDTHITPALTAKTFAVRMDSLIQGSFHLYSQGTVWLASLYLLTLGSLFLYIFQSVFSWVFYINLIFSFIATYIFVIDLEREVFVQEKKRA